MEYNKNNYGALLKKAIAEFDEGNGNPRTALNTLYSAKEHSNGRNEWLYSETFIYFWLENYDKAIKCCNKLKKKNYEGEEITIKEVILFNEKLINKYNKTQLKFWLGFLCYVKDHNPALADKYFQEFIDEADNNMYELSLKAKSYLVEIKKEIGYQ